MINVPPTARVSDPTGHPGVILPPGVPTVLIGGVPAARMGGLAGCGGPIASSCPTVVIA